MTATTTAVDADRALKTKHRAMWASGDYPAWQADLISTLGPVLVDACAVRSGDRVLDVAAGAGNAAIPAALAGAEVVASDLTPELFDAGRRRPRPWAPCWNGRRPTPRPCRSLTATSTPCCPASG